MAALAIAGAAALGAGSAGAKDMLGVACKSPPPEHCTGEACVPLRASPGMQKAKETVASYAAQAREELDNLPEGLGRQALAILVDYTVNRHG
jgi:hypothetical protein